MMFQHRLERKPPLILVASIKPPKPCALCGTMFVPPPASPLTKLCSEACRRQWTKLKSAKRTERKKAKGI